MTTPRDDDSAGETSEWIPPANPGSAPAEISRDDTTVAALNAPHLAPAWSPHASPGLGASQPHVGSSTHGGPLGPYPGPHVDFTALPIPQAKKGSGRRAMAIAAAAAAVLVVAASASAGTWYLMHRNDPGPQGAGHDISTPPTFSHQPAPAPTSTPAAQAFAPSGLSALLLSVPEMNGLLGATTTPTQIERQPFGYDTVTAKPNQCTGAVLPGMKATYSYYSKSTGFVGQILSQDSPTRITAIQTATTFPTAADAEQFLKDQEAQWQDCQDTEVTITSTRERSSTVSEVTQPTTADDILSVHINGISNGELPQPAGDCDRAITTRLNVVVDVRVCAPDPATLGHTLARTLADRVTTQR